ncbi:FBF1 factor, partial [Dicaeum eximium]|nr:FBF1 factor [Dicaeum eximium]
QEREEQIHALADRSVQQQQDGQRALREARSVQAGQRERLQALQEQQEQLRQQEQRLHQANAPFPSPGSAGRSRSCPAVGQRGQGRSAVPSAAAPVAPGLLPAVGMFLGDGGAHLGTSGHTWAHLGSAALYGHLLLLKHRARMDHDFLEKERLFLESLKKGP